MSKRVVITADSEPSLAPSTSNGGNISTSRSQEKIADGTKTLSRFGLNKYHQSHVKTANTVSVISLFKTPAIKTSESPVVDAHILSSSEMTKKERTQSENLLSNNGSGYASQTLHGRSLSRSTWMNKLAAST